MPCCAIFLSVFFQGAYDLPGSRSDGESGQGGQLLPRREEGYSLGSESTGMPLRLLSLCIYRRFFRSMEQRQSGNRSRRRRPPPKESLFLSTADVFEKGWSQAEDADNNGGSETGRP